MSPSGFETDYACPGDSTALALIRREGRGAQTQLFAGFERSDRWSSPAMPAPVRQIVARGGRSWWLTPAAVHESRDGGLTSQEMPLPNGAQAVLAAGEDGPLVAVGAQVLAHEGDVWGAFWELPAPLVDEKVSALIAMGREVLVMTNRLRIFRGAGGDRSLRDFSAGLPPPLSGGAYQTLNVRRLGDWYLGYAGRLYLRHAEDSSWKPADASAPNELRGVVESHSPDWVAAPWARAVWIGHDGTKLLTSGPGLSLESLWSPPTGAPQIVKRLVAGKETVMASFRRATRDLSGVTITQGIAEAVRLPVS
ncbi:MAG TPA: hypothetical protein VGI39_25920 [Polyangiaceae bacterium]|jgi:hypothetical protein